MEDFIKLLFYPACLLAFGKWIGYRLEQQKEEQNSIYQHQVEELAKKQQREAERDLKIEKLINGELASLRDRIMQSCNFFIVRGEITPLALENISMMHQAYKDLGGNGLTDRQFEQVNQLPVENFDQSQIPKRRNNGGRANAVS